MPSETQAICAAFAMADAMDSDDDEPRLSAHALTALSEFYAEQAALDTGERDVSRSGPLTENWVLTIFICYKSTY